MQIILIEHQGLIKDILKHLGLWFIRLEPPPKARTPPTLEYVKDGACSTSDDDSYADSDHVWDYYIRA